MIPEDILEKQDLPKVVIISVSVIGVILLLINIGLVAGCILKKRAKRIKGNSFLNITPPLVSTSKYVVCILLSFIFINQVYFLEQGGQSSKSATIEMYAPSSYNDTVTGETLSSVSEKSETYSNEGSNADYVVIIFY